MKRTLNGVTTYYIYDGEKPILEYNSTGGQVGWNLYGKAIDEIIERGATGSDGVWHWYFYQQDHEGSVSHLTNGAGTVIEKYRYDAFGAPTIYNSLNTQLSTSAYNNRFLFTGREYAATFSFYEYRARAYNPTLGRFMSEDPKGFDAGDYNLYRYCHNDPEDLTDPMGLGLDVLRTIPPSPFGYEMDRSRLATAMAQRAFEVGLSIRTGVHAENYGSPFRITSRNIAVDYDGAPGAYGGPGIKGVETMANAAPGDRTIAYKDGKPVVENGWYVSKTSFHRGDQNVQKNNINGSIYPFAALGNKQTFGAKPGDVVHATNNLTGKGQWMVYGDSRGGRNTGLEFSPAALRGLEVPFRGNNVSPTPVTVVIYPHSASGDFP